MRTEREARNWSQADAVHALRAHSPKPLAGDTASLRNWKRWEAGTYPDEFYRPLIAKTFGTVTTALFPHEGRRNGDAEVLAVSGAGTLEILSRLRASDLNADTLDGCALRSIASAASTRTSRLRPCESRASSGYAASPTSSTVG